MPPRSPEAHGRECIGATLCPSPELHPTRAGEAPLPLHSPAEPCELVHHSLLPSPLHGSHIGHRTVPPMCLRTCALGCSPLLPPPLWTAPHLLPLLLGSEAPTEPWSGLPGLPIPVSHPGQGSLGPGPVSDSAQRSQRSREMFRRNRMLYGGHTGLPLPTLARAIPWACHL